MRSGASLNVQGVRPEAIETAREAARRSGQSLGQWLNSAIIETAAEVGVRSPPRGIHPHALDWRGGNGGVNERLDVLANRLDRLATRSTDTAIASTPVAAPGRVDADIAPSLRAIEPRLDSHARDLSPEKQAIPPRLAAAITLLNNRLDQLTVQRPATPDRESPMAAEDDAPAVSEPPHSIVGALDPHFRLDRAIVEIAERQGALDGVRAAADRREDEINSASEPAPPQASAAVDLSGLERQLRHITDQIETLRRSCGVEDAIAALRRDIAAIGRTITEAVPRRTIEALQGELGSLAARIDSDGHRGPAAAALDGVERGLAEVREALATLTPAESLAGFAEELKALSHKIDLLAATGPDAEILHQIEGAVAELRGMVGRVASGEALAALAADVRGIGGKLDGFMAEFGGAGGDMGRLVQRIESLAAAIDARAVDGAVPARFESLIDTVARKLEAVRPAADTAAFGHLEDRIVRLAQKLDASDGNLGAIERGLGDLMVQLKAVHTSAVEAAERAAREAAREIVDESTGADSAVDELKHDVTALRESQADNDRRTQDTLEAVHRTLDRLIDRLAMVESDVHAQAQRREAVGHVAPSQAGPAPYRPASPAPAPSRRPLPPRDQAPINPSLPADHPLEPGSVSPRGSAAASPAERIAASATVPGTVKPQLAAEPGGKANFIAAARRAAQVAASDTAMGAQRADVKKAPGAMLGAIGSAISKRRRQLLIGICAFLIVVGMLNLAVSLLASSDHGRAEPPRRASNEPPEPSRDDAKHRATAHRFYLAAAEKGNGKAMHNLAVLYAEGIDGKPDYRTAAQWFRKAADRGVSDGQYNLGILYARGVGVEQDLAESFKWFALAANQGDRDAGNKRNEVATRLDPQSLVAARLAVQTFTVDPQPDEAIKVKAPPGQWDRPHSAAPPAKSNATGRKTTSL